MEQCRNDKSCRDDAPLLKIFGGYKTVLKDMIDHGTESFAGHLITKIKDALMWLCPIAAVLTGIDLSATRSHRGSTAFFKRQNP